MHFVKLAEMCKSHDLLHYKEFIFILNRLLIIQFQIYFP